MTNQENIGDNNLPVAEQVTAGDQSTEVAAHKLRLADGIYWERLFPATVGDFSANNAAEAFLRAHGFSVGSMQRGDPRGIMFGNYDIAKWRNLRPGERHELHGVLAYRNGSARGGDAIVRIFVNAPDEARAALALATSTSHGSPVVTP